MSEIEKLFEATKPFRDEIAKLQVEVVNGKTRYGCLKIQEEAALKERDSALLQIGALKKVVDAADEMAKAYYSEMDTNWGIGDGRFDMWRLPEYARFMKMRITNETRKDPTDDERRAAKEAQDKKFRPPDWTRSGRHG